MPEVGRGALLILVAALRPRCGSQRLCAKPGNGVCEIRVRAKTQETAKLPKTFTCLSRAGLAITMRWLLCDGETAAVAESFAFL